MQSRFKNLLRKVDRIEYENTDLPSEYEKVQEDYRIVKKKLDNLKSIFIHFMTYEHGGKAYKTTMRAIEIVGRKVKADAFELRSFYKQSEETAKEIAKVQSNEQLKTLAQQYSEAFNVIEDEKIKMNNDLEEVVKEIKVLQDKSRTIDESRAHVLNLRYDLEKMYKKKGPEDEELSTLKNEFSQKASLTKEDMKAYVGDKGVSEIMKKACAVQAEFYKAAASALQSVK